MSTARRVYWRVAATTGIALLTSILPLPDMAMPWRVAWPQLVLIYWCMALPHYCGIKYAWATGLATDLLHGGIFGQNALLCIILAYVTMASHQFLRSLSLQMQTLFVGVLLLLPTGLAMGIEALVYSADVHWSRWGAVLSSMLAWPWVFAVLRRTRQRIRAGRI